MYGTYVGNEKYLGQKMRIWIRNTAFFPSKFADLRFADWDTKESCVFAICGLIITNLRIFDLRTGTPQQFADQRLRNEPKSWQICVLWTNIKDLRAHLWARLLSLREKTHLSN